MKCPKCEGLLESVDFGTDISVMRCDSCHGLFSNTATLEKMREQWLSDTVLDTGSAAVGARNNALQDIQCPGCHTIMERVEDIDQSHIQLDLCPSCDGVFLDAGELTDMKHVTLMDHIKRLLGRL
jgi:uncharacterized protein